jgi:hypothetical protein
LLSPASNAEDLFLFYRGRDIGLPNANVLKLTSFVVNDFNKFLAVSILGGFLSFIAMS